MRGTTSLRELILKTNGPDCFHFFLFQIQRVGPDFRLLIPVVIIKHRDLIAVHGHIMLSGSLLNLRQTELVAFAGEFPFDLVLLLGAVKAQNRVQMAEGTDQIPIIVQPHGVEMDDIRRVHLLIGEVIGCRRGFCHDQIIQLGIVDALPVPYHFTVLHFLQIRVNDIGAVRISGNVLHLLFDVAGKDIVVRVDHQKIVAIRPLPFLGHIRCFHGDPLDLIEIFIHDHPLTRSIAEQPVVVELVVLIMIAVVGRAVHIVLLEIPETSVDVFCRLVLMLRPDDISLAIQHDQVPAVHKGQEEVSRQVCFSLHLDLRKSIGDNSLI